MIFNISPPHYGDHVYIICKVSVPIGFHWCEFLTKTEPFQSRIFTSILAFKTFKYPKFLVWHIYLSSKCILARISTHLHSQLFYPKNTKWFSLDCNIGYTSRRYAHYKLIWGRTFGGTFNSRMKSLYAFKMKGLLIYIYLFN